MRLVLTLLLLLQGGVVWGAEFKASEKFAKKCDGIRQVPDGPGGFLVKNSDHGGHIVMLSDTELEFDRMQMFRFLRKRKEGGELVTRFRKLRNLTYTGRANGNRQHWRDYSRSLSDLPRRRILFRGRESETGLFFCYVLNRVDEERND